MQEENGTRIIELAFGLTWKNRKMRKFLSKLIIALSLFVFALTIPSFSLGVESKTSANALQVVEKIADVYLVAGQSNAEGCSLISGGAGPCYEEQPGGTFEDRTLRYDNVLYNHNVLLTLGGGAYQITDFIPVVQGLGWNNQHIGPELGMAQILDPIYAQKENTDAVIIKVADGGTSLIRHYDDAYVDLEKLGEQHKIDANSGTWYPESLWNVCIDDYKVDLWNNQFYNHPTGYLYRELISFIKLNYDLLIEKGYTKINFKALCWMQGESDVGGNLNEYQNVLAAFTNDVRAQVSLLSGEDYSTLPIVIGELGITNGNINFVNAQRQMPQELNHSYVMDNGKYKISGVDENGNTVIYGSDGAHWAYPDMIEVGKMFGQYSYESNKDDKWVYLSVRANRDDRYDRTTLENVKIDVNKFNDDGKLSFSCDLKKIYDITSLKVGETDLMPYLTQTVDGNVRKYSLDATFDNAQDVTFEASFENAKTYTVSLSIANEGKGYGSKIYTYPTVVYEKAGEVKFRAIPSQGGRVYKVTVNGKEVVGAKNKTEIVIDNIFAYADETEKFAIVVQYGPRPEPKIVASGYIGSFEVGETFELGNLVVKYYDQEENETVLDASEYTVDYSRVNTAVAGNYLVEIKYGNYTANYTVSVVAPTLEIENAKTVFIKGEQFSIGAPQVYLVTKAGRTLLDASQYLVIAPLYNANVAGEYDVVVSMESASGTYKVTVVQPTAILVENAKTEFSGEEFSAGAIVVKAVVNGNEYILSESQYTVDSSAFKQTKNGTYTITVTASGVSATYSVTVSGIASASAGCGASLVDVLALVATLCGLALIFKKR